MRAHADAAANFGTKSTRVNSIILFKKREREREYSVYSVKSPSDFAPLSPREIHYIENPICYKKKVGCVGTPARDFHIPAGETHIIQSRNLLGASQARILRERQFYCARARRVNSITEKPFWVFEQRLYYKHALWQSEFCS